MKFIPSLELSRMLFEEEIQPIVAESFPDLPYAAGTIGMCSETFGLDDVVSMDHNWGPRVTIFLSQADKPRYADELSRVFHERLPGSFHGFEMFWKDPKVDVQDTTKAIMYNVWVSTVLDTLDFYGGLKTFPLPESKWLQVSEQHLLEITSGVVFRDDSGALTRVRELLQYYPDNVLRFLLMNEWNMVGGDWFPIGRIGSRGDLLGLRLQAAKVVQRMMRIAYMVSRRYFPYKKWFGTLFKRLPIAADLEPVLEAILQSSDWQVVEEKIGDAARILLAAQNVLNIAPKTVLKSKEVDDGRHHIDYDFWAIGNGLRREIQPPLKALLDDQVFWLHEKSLILWNEEFGKLGPVFLRKSK